MKRYTNRKKLSVTFPTTPLVFINSEQTFLSVRQLLIYSLYNHPDLHHCTNNFEQRS